MGYKYICSELFVGTDCKMSFGSKLELLDNYYIIIHSSVIYISLGMIQTFSVMLLNPANHEKHILAKPGESYTKYCFPLPLIWELNPSKY